MSLSKRPDGYLHLRDYNFKTGKTVKVHRRIYEVFNDEIPDGM